MEENQFGDEDVQILQGFRRVARGLWDAFQSRRDHIQWLLGPNQNYSSGIFREGLLRDSLRDILPRGVDVSTGFIYGFEKLPNSAQLDIIVWDSSRHAAVYKTDSFVVVPPEAVIAVVSVKTGMTPPDVTDAVENLLSVVPLDLAYRAGLKRPLPPITKFVVSFNPASSPDSIGNAVAEVMQQRFANDQRLADTLVPILATMDPTNPTRDQWWQFDRTIPRLILSLDKDHGCAFIRGWGPASEILDGLPHGIRRLPYLYLLRSKLTSPFEKFVYHLLADVYQFLGTPGGSLIAAWGDFHPIYGFRVGDASEIEPHRGFRLLDPGTVLAPRSNSSDAA